LLTLLDRTEKGVDMNGRPSWRGVRRLVACILVFATTAVPHASASERQIRFKVPHPFRVGSHVYEAGVVAIGSVSEYTPSIALFKVWVNDDCLGIVTAHRSVSEVPPQGTEALFHRDDDGRLEMVGFRVTGRPTGTTYRFSEVRDAAALSSAQTDLASTISPLTARRAASANGSFSTVNTSSSSRADRVGTSSSAR
jgi:hypothetical protein